MAAEAEPAEIGDSPDLVSLAEEVRASNEPRVLRRNGEEIARIVPLRRRLRPDRKHTDADYEAFLASAGGWADIDVDAFLAANRESRDRSTSIAVEL